MTTVWVVISDGDGGIDADVFTTEEAAERYREALYVSTYGMKDGTGLARRTLDFDHDFYASVRDCELVEDPSQICEQLVANRERRCTCTRTEDEGGEHLVPDPECDGDPCESKAGEAE